QPLENVCVNLLDSSDENGLVNSTQTDADGHYSLVGLPAGSYKVQFTGCGSNVLGEWWDNKPDFGSATAITLTEGQDKSGTDAALAPGASISGTVTDDGTTPQGLGGICVTAYDASAGSDGQPSQVDSTTTNANGDYEIAGLPG